MKSYIFRRQRLVTAMIGVMTIMFLNGCASTESRQLEQDRDSGKFYKAYLVGDVNQARQNLEQLIQLFQSQRAKILGVNYQAHSLFCIYARLYVLEKKAGNKDDAEVALIKAGYWHLEDYELSNDGWKNKTPIKEFLSYNTPEYIALIVDKLDNGSTKGKGPNYIQYLTHTQPNN